MIVKHAPKIFAPHFSLSLGDGVDHMLAQQQEYAKKRNEDYAAKTLNKGRRKRDANDSRPVHETFDRMR